MLSNLWMLCNHLIYYLIWFKFWDYGKKKKKDSIFLVSLLALLTIWSNRIEISIFISKAWILLWNNRSEIWTMRGSMAWWFVQTFSLEEICVSVIKEKYIKWDSKLGSIESLSPISYFICLYEDHNEKYFSLNVLVVGSLGVHNYMLIKSRTL